MTTPPLFEYIPEINKLRLGFHDGQILAWDSEKRFVFVLAGTQSGKTSFGPYWLWREIVMNGPGDYLAVTANYKLFGRKMLPELLRVFGDQFKTGRYWGSAQFIEIKNPNTKKFEGKNAFDPKMYARILLASAVAGKGKEVGVSALESATAKAAWIDECGLDEFSLGAWEAILRRVALFRGRVLGTTTLYNLGWMKTEVYTPWERGDPDIDIIQFDSIMNPVFPRSEYERARRTLPAWKFNMQYRGRYDRPSGMIYSSFDDARHVVKPFHIPDKWPRIVGIDPGAVNTATEWLAHDFEHHCFFLYRDTLEGNMTTRDHVAKAKERTSGSLDEVIFVGGSISEKQFRMDWQQEGIRVREPGVDDVEAGIDRVHSLFREDKLFIFDSARGIRDELGTYARKLDERGQPIETIKDKERYHRLDALRYAVSIISTTERTGIPAEGLFSKREIPSFGSSDRVPGL